MSESPYNRKAVGERIRRRRNDLGLTQAELAERIGRAVKYCADIERGSCGMSIETLLQLCGTLRMSPSTLMLGEAVPDLGAEDTIGQIAAGLAECTQEERESVLQIVRLLTKKR